MAVEMYVILVTDQVANSLVDLDGYKQVSVNLYKEWSKFECFGPSVDPATAS